MTTQARARHPWAASRTLIGLTEVTKRPLARMRANRRIYLEGKLAREGEAGWKMGHLIVHPFSAKLDAMLKAMKVPPHYRPNRDQLGQ